MDQQIIPAERILPNRLFIIPMSGKPIFPGIFTPLIISGADEINTIEQSLAGDNFIGLVLTRDDEVENPGSSELYTVGTVAKIVKRINLPDGGMNVLISTLKRFRVRKYIAQETPLIAVVDYIDDESDDTLEIKALTRSLLSEMKQISENNPLFSEEMRLNMVNIDHPGKIADFITSILNIDRKDQQKILETIDTKSRMEQVLMFIKKEQELLRIQKRIQRQINDKVEKSQREYFLKEELKAIKQELGMTVDSKSSEYQRFREIIEKLNLEGEVKEQVENELEKFSLMDPNASEFIVTRNYLDTIVSLPWNDSAPLKIDIKRAKRILDADHYGLEDVKERILEFLAVSKLRENSRGSILCLVGPPGVGKTSIGKSIARALNRPFFRFSVGGMRDEAEIKGHRRTYVGAMPGKMIQGLKIVKMKDPVFMIDEIDKMGASYQGDPSSALLEVLDPEQNHAFRDHYLDLPFDLSHIFFIATANTLDTIPAPLLDRMEIIRLSGYIDAEKVAIATRYLIPKSLERSGLDSDAVSYDKKTLTRISEEYARESGMRSYEKLLDKIHRKIAKSLVLEEHTGTVQVKADDLVTYLGKPIFGRDPMKKTTRPGLVTGLAWTAYGGDTLVIEAVSTRGGDGIKLTGQMGQVMQESASIAYTYAKHLIGSFGIPDDALRDRQVHLHIPAGATPKDGPSAGITMATALVSLLSNRKVKKNLAMTGELSLSGRVLPIGGLKEKTIAARRNQVKEIIIPRENEKDLDEIPEYVRKGIVFHPVETMEEVLKLVF